MLAGFWQAAAGADSLAFPTERLFAPLGMASAVLEADARGHFVGSSYLYATAQDWARFGEFLLQEGAWDGKALLPPGFVAWMRSEVPASKGAYGRGQLWLRWRPDWSDVDVGEGRLPPDTFWLRGHDGQYIAIVPSRKLVMVRMGLTPGRHRYAPQAALGRLLGAIDAPPR
jgi:CubicO group peptidase (beta-lactamase class C family)